MAKTSQADRVKRWTTRIAAANRRYKAWEDRFQCPRLYNYYLGHQWRGESETDAQKLYVTNLVFPTIETQLPTLLFSSPHVQVDPRPAKADDVGSEAGARAQLIESTLQTFVDDPKLFFKAETTSALRDTPFRFGIVEVGYSSDYLDNPNAGKPVLLENSEDAMLDSGGKPVTQPAKLIQSEELYLRRVPPHTFRVSASNRPLLSRNDWIGCYEWQYVEDVKRNPAYRNTASLTAGGKTDDTTPDEPELDGEDGSRHADMVKLWRLWDLRRKVRHVIAEGHDKFLQEDFPITRHPFAALKFYEIADSFYPLPPVFNWLSPQDEKNEKREAQRTQRKRSARRYMRDGSVLSEEFEKLAAGGDGTCILVPQISPPPIVPIVDAPIDHRIFEDGDTDRDFLQISGVGGDARGESDPGTDTATQANIQNARLQIRESHLRRQVGDWLSEIVRLMLETAREKMQLPFWVQMNSDPFAGDQQGQQATARQWQEISSEKLGDLDVDVRVDVTSLSPISEQQQGAAWLQVLAILKDPQTLALVMQPNPASPETPSALLVKILGGLGIKSPQDVLEIQRIGREVLAEQKQMAMAQMLIKGGPVPGPGGPPSPAPGGPPSQPAAGVPVNGPMAVQ